MSNPAVIKLQNKKIGTHSIGIEDNLGEAIHIHIDDFRVDLTIHEFTQMYSDICDAINELVRIRGFDCHKIDPIYFEVMLWKDLHRLLEVRSDQIMLKDILVPDFDGTMEPLPECRFVKALEGNASLDYPVNDSNYMGQSNQDRLYSLCQSIRENGYPCNGEYIILYGDDNAVKDGGHRAACLWHIHGDISIPVIRLYLKDYLPPAPIPAWKKTAVYQGIRKARRAVCSFLALLKRPRQLYRVLRQIRQKHRTRQKERRRRQYLKRNREKAADILAVLENK